MSRDSSRKPSSSSTRSGTHSPTPSPGNQPHSSRRITPTTTGNMLSVGVAGGAGLMSYSSGWEMWGSGPPSQRNPSLSSPVNASDIPPSQGDSGYRGPIREGWTSSSRPPSGMRDEDTTQSPHLKDFSQSHEAPTPLSLHSSRHRQGSAAPFSAPGSDNQPAKLSPQGYDLNLNRESSPRYSSASSTFTSAPYSASHSTHSQPPPTGASGYETLVSPAVDDLSLRFRGMAVEDDFSVRQRGHPPPPPMLPNLMQRPQHPVHTARPPYNNYPPAFSEYSYGPGYDHRSMDPNVYGSPPLNNASYSNVPTLVPTHSNDIHHHPNNVFYDFPPPRPSQYYYPPQQGVIFPPNTSPMVPSQLPALPTSFDKKRELSYNLNMQQQQHQLMAQALMFPRITPSPPLPIYTNVMDYSQLPLMMPGGPLYDANMAVALYHSMQQGAQSLRSPILEEFRINKTRRWELRDIAGHVVEFSGDQHGSRFIQQKLETASSDEKQKVFDEIVPNNILQLIQDVFGNYVIQKMFEHGTQLQKTRLAAEMDGRVLALSKQMYGCRVVQKAIECVLPEQQAAIVHELEPHIMECIHDGNGNHVVQKMIERVPPERLGFVHSFRGNVQVLAGHMYGCRVLQRAFEYLPEVMIVPLIDELHACTLTLMRNQFGNYVMQFMIEHGKAQDRALVIAKLRGQLLNMARHKFASNVCEKALTFADPETRRSFIDEIITPRPEGLTVLSMIKDQYANYVLQRAVVVAEADQRETLIRQIRSQLVTLRRFSHGYNKHLVSIEKLLQKYAPK